MSIPSIALLISLLWTFALGATIPCVDQALRSLRESRDWRTHPAGLADLIACHERHREAHRTLVALLEPPGSPFPNDLWAEALLSSSTDTATLGAALFDPRALFSSDAAMERAWRNPHLWRGVPELFYRCAVENFKIKPTDLEVIGRASGPALDDLETRHRCLISLAHFPDLKSLTYLESILRQQPALLGYDATRTVKFILGRALEKGDAPVVREANLILLRTLDDYARAPRGQVSTLRLGAAGALGVPGNRTVATALDTRIRKEKDPDVGKFLRQARTLIEENVTP